MSDYLAPIWETRPSMRSFTVVFTKCKDDDWCLEQSNIDFGCDTLSDEHLQIVKEGHKNKLKECFRGEKGKVVFVRPSLILNRLREED